MDTTKPTIFTVDDGEGNPHTYETRYHPAEEGLELSFALIGLLGEPLIMAVGDIKGAADGDVEDVLDLAGALGALRAIEPKQLMALSTQLLKYTARDGAALRGHVFTKAYMANYSELYMAMWKIIEANRFIPLLGTPSGETEGE